ncbi:MAG: FAD:protein FMN transferase [Spirochaetaceae bacterium]|nr:FAD:protein FMN transferase [Spirochaetaceae bacterium]
MVNARMPPDGRPSVKVGTKQLLLSVALASAGLLSCSPPAEPATRREKIFTATCAISLYDHGGEEAFSAAFAALRETDARLSMWRPDSELAALNSRAGQGPQAVSPQLRSVLARGLDLARLSGGRYDPSVGPLVRLWGVGTEREALPPPEAIAAARALVGWKEVELDPATSMVELTKPGMALDFGSLAKGEGAVRAGEALAAAGVRSAVVDVGGSILALGSKPGGKAWRIGIQRPGSARGEMLGYVELRDAAVNTSGIYERWFEAEGRRWNHIVDTDTGYPLDNGLLSVTVIRPRRESGDGPSLAILCLGLEKGLALAEELELAAILVDAERGIHLSSGARGLFTLVDPDYHLSDS